MLIMNLVFLFSLVQNQVLVKCPIENGDDVYPYVKVDVGNKIINLILDTGAPVSSLDTERCKHIKTDWSMQNEIQLGKRRVMHESAHLDMVIGGKRVNTLFVPKSTNSINENNSYYSSIKYDGLLGYDFMRRHRATINIEKMEMSFWYEKNPNQK